MARPARLTFLGHSTVLIELAGVRILTDPILFDRVGPLRRVVTPVDPEAYRAIDVVLLSHLHLDHFDVPSLRMLGPDVRMVVPIAAGRLLERLGFSSVDELAPGQRLVIGEGLAITATPAAHGGFRPPLGPRAAAVGYVIETDDERVYFAGDTDLFPQMADLVPNLHLALLPVWGWGPSLGRGHLDPARAAQAVRLLRPQFVVPIHWGTLWPFGLGRVRPGRLAQPPLEFAMEVARTDPDATVLVTAPGERVPAWAHSPNGATSEP